MKYSNVIFTIVTAFLVLGVFFMNGTAIAKDMSEFIAYSPWVPTVRKILFVLGSAVVIMAFSYFMISKFFAVKDVVVMSDRAALFFFLIMLVEVPLLCFGLVSITHCDFWQLQQASSCVIMVMGIVVAVRVQQWRYVFYYVILFLLFGGTSPPT